MRSITRQKKNPAFKALVYFSDHGEEPHVVGGHDPVNVTYQMLKVPLFVYLSDSYRKNHLNLFESLKSNEHKYFSNDLIFDLMVSLMRIEGVPNFEESLNLSSKKYRLDKASTLTMYGKKHINEFSEEKN